MKRVLITGITGFVGTNLLAHFKDNEEIVLFGHSRKQNFDKASGWCYHQPVLLSTLGAQTLNENKIDVIIHLAGIAHDLSNQYKPEDYYRVNFEGTKKLYDEFLKSSASKFIFVSSIKAACDVASSPVDESIVPNPITDYGKSKRMAEEYILSIPLSNRKSFYILRPGMIHGAGNKGNLNLLYKFVKLGLPFPFGAFHNQRSFLSVDNFSFVIESLIKKKIESGIYHLADDGFLSTVELYKLISKTVGKKSLVLNVPKKFIETMAALTGKKAMIGKLTENMMISNKKIVNAIGSPFPISMEEGLTKTISSFDAN